MFLPIPYIGAWERCEDYGIPEIMTFTNESGERIYKCSETKISVNLHNPEPIDDEIDILYGYCKETGVYCEVDSWLRIESEAHLEIV